MSLNPVVPVPAHKAIKMGGFPINATAEKKSAAPVQGAEPVKAKQESKPFSFFDLLDIVNPLQHIPIVGTVYRKITGDEIGGFARVAGGALFGGFIGAIAGGVNAIAAQETGQDLGQMAMNKLGIGDDATKKDAKPVVDVAESSPVAAKPVENLPVIEVRPMAAAAKANLDPALDDAPVASIAAKNNFRRFNSYTSNMPIRTDQAVTSKMPAAMPSPKDLNDLTPGVAMDSAQVPGQMMQALAKYQAMQGMIKSDTDKSAPRFASFDPALN